MKKTGAQLAIFAFEQLGIRFTYGIPGTHTTELYDELNKSSQITPILVTHEGGGSFMADATSRTSDSIGTLVIVPAAGLTHAMSGIGEAFLDGIPMIVLAGGIRTDTGRHYQLHHFDQMTLAKPITKAQFAIEKHEDIIPTIYEAYEIATSGEPGPVFIELPINLTLFAGNIDELPVLNRKSRNNAPDLDKIKAAVEMIKKASKPMMFVGWGAVDASEESVKLAEMLAAPVSTTLQGKSAFPNSHALYTSVGLGASSKPSAQWALAEHDLLLAVGTRFGEIATGSYGLEPPKNLIHIDINPEVFDKNFKTSLAIEADAKEALTALIEALETDGYASNRDNDVVGSIIKQKNDDYFNSWLEKEKDDIVSPGYFFKSLKKQLDEDVQLVIDDGKHTFLASELYPVDHARHFISPTDFNCMGYCVPAAIAAKLVNPGKQVAAIVGDGAFLMTGMEMITAASYKAPVMFFVFNDGELGQISQFQKIPLNRKTCSELGIVDYEGFAIATGGEYVVINNDHEIDEGIAQAIQHYNNGHHVVINVKIDYTKKTMLTKGVVKVNLKRFPFKEKVRFLARALKRHTLG
jgi:acetolactate synthase I/II/III large subunit